MKESLCWSCTCPGTDRCSWDESLTPVEGWEAEPTVTDGFETFRVINCPLYIKDPPRALRYNLPIRRMCPDGKSRVLLTDSLIRMFDHMGLTLEEVSALTGVKSGIIYQRRLKLRKMGVEK